MTTTRTRLTTLITIGAAAAAAWLTSLPAAAQGAHEHPQAAAPVPQVIITAKRLTAAERQAEDAAAQASQQVHRVVIVAKRLHPQGSAPIGVAARDNPAPQPM